MGYNQSMKIKKTLAKFAVIAVVTMVVFCVTDAEAANNIREAEEEVTGVINRFLNGVVLPFFQAIVDMLVEAVQKLVPSFLRGGEPTE